ncbi:MAG: 2-C-methyl-D-erythritol 4-phosphate cytidylyltransferase [Candidatus Dormibacteria bacterium]
MSCAAILPCAGLSRRMGGGGDKMLIEVAGRPVAEWTLRAVAASGCIERVVVMASTANRARLAAVAARAQGLVVEVLDGGSRRQDSVRAGLEHLAGYAPDAVLVHDGARPMVPVALLRSCAEAAEAGESVTAGVPLKDAVKEVDADRIVVRSFRRDALFGIQTPQAFPFQTLLQAHRDGAAHLVDDDAELVERLGIRVRVLAGDYRNLKLTTPEDVEFAASYLTAAGRPA